MAILVLLASICRISSVHACEHGLYLASHWLKKDPSREQLQRISGNKFKDAYIQLKGTNPASIDVQRRAKMIQNAASPVRIQGWEAFKICGNEREGCLNLNRSDDRQKIIKAAKLVWGSGFDGFHLDAEPIASGDPSFRELLVELKNAKPIGKTLSIATVPLTLQGEIRNQVHPVPLSGASPFEWDVTYYRSLLPLVDQIMVMNYDTALRSPEEYTRYTTWQASQFSVLIENTATELRIGVPVYAIGRFGVFFKAAENFKSANEGLKKAWGRSGQCPSRSGLAIFIETEFTAKDQKAFESDWFKK